MPNKTFPYDEDAIPSMASTLSPPLAFNNSFSDITTWVFDLDNTLYPASTRLFDLIDERMGVYIQRLLVCDADEARRVQKAHFHSHGTTLAGLMREHGVDPHHFLADVHDISLDRISANSSLDRNLKRLPGRKVIFTNGDAPYARRVLDRLGVEHHFDHLHDIHAVGLRPKPEAHGYRLLIEQLDLDPTRTAMIEDMAQNLIPAKALGMTTIWVDNGSERGDHAHHPDYIDLTISDVGQWLEEMTREIP